MKFTRIDSAKIVVKTANEFRLSGFGGLLPCWVHPLAWWAMIQCYREIRKIDILLTVPESTNSIK